MAKTASRSTAERDHIDNWLEQLRDQLPMLDLRVEGIVDRINGINRRIRRMGVTQLRN